jgi:hypothetical protein
LLVESCTSRNLVPMLNTRDTLHITENDDPHNIPLSDLG